MNILEESKKAIPELPSSLENNSMRDELSRLIEIVYALLNGLALSLQGKLDQSSQIILQAKRLAEEAGNIFLLAHAYEGLALNLYNQGQLWSAASTSRQLIELAEGGFRKTHLGQPLPIAAAGYLLQANICLDQNKLEEMAQFLAKAFELCRMNGGAKSLVETYIMQSRLQQAQGDLDDAYQYVPNTSDWHRINQGTIYNINPNLQWMNVTDRTFFLLQSIGVPLTRNEYIGIHLTDGLYEDKNKPYLVTFDKNFQLRTNLPIILHHADMLALHTERDMWRAEQESLERNISKINPQTAPKRAESDPQKRNADLKKTFEKSTNAASVFDELFKGKITE